MSASVRRRTLPLLFGMDFPRREELIAAFNDVETIRQFLDVDSLEYLSVEKLLEAVPAGRCGYCTCCSPEIIRSRSKGRTINFCTSMRRAFWSSILPKEKAKKGKRPLRVQPACLMVSSYCGRRSFSRRGRPFWRAFVCAAPTPPIRYLYNLAAGATGAAFLLNQLVDRREDALNRKLLPLWDGMLSPRFIKVELFILGAGTVLGGIWAGGELSALLTLSSLSRDTYTMPAISPEEPPDHGYCRLFRRRFDSVVMGARTGGSEFGSALLFSLPYIFAGAAASLLTHVPDIEGDRQSGATTFASKHGLRATAMAALIMVAAALISALWFRDFVMLIAALAALPFFIRFHFKLSVEAAQTAVKSAIFSLAVAVGTTWFPSWL